MKKISLFIMAATLGILLIGGIGQVYASPLTSCTYELFYQSGANWLQVLPTDTVAFDANRLWKYSYTLNNLSGSLTPVTWWHVYAWDYPATNYVSDLTRYSPTGWNNTTGSHAAGLFAETYSVTAAWQTENISYDLPIGQSLKGFDVTFKWSNQDAIPGSQHYEGGNGGSQSGFTTPVPEPASMSLLGLGVLGLFGLRKRKVA